MTPEVFPSTILLWEWLHLSQRTVCFTTVAKHHTCNLLSLSVFWFPWVFSVLFGATSLAYHTMILCPVTYFLGAAHCAATGSMLIIKIICSAYCDFFVVSGGRGREECRCFPIILREFWLTPWVEFSVPPATKKRVLLNRRYRIELLIFVFFLVSIVLFQAKAF